MIADFRPYPAMKDSGVEWLGKVPEHWDIAPLCSIAKTKSITDQQDRELLSVYLNRGVIRFSEIKEKRTNVTSEDLSKYQAVDPGDFVLNNQQAWRGSVGVSKHTGIVSPAYLVLSLDSRINPEFANLLFRERTMVAQYLIASRGVGSIQRNLYWPYLKRVSTFLPPLPEQAAIVRYLDHVDRRVRRLVRTKRKLIALLTEQKQAIIHRAVTRGLDPDVPLKDSGVEWLGEVPDHWEIVALKFLCGNIQNGTTPSTSKEHYYQDGTVPWFGPSSISASDELKVGSPIRFLAKPALDEGKARLIVGPAVLIIVIGATAGRMGLLLGEGATNQQITAFEFKSDRIDPFFAIKQLGFCESWLRSTASTATIPILDSALVSRLLLAFPSIPDQQRIVSATATEALPVDVAMGRAKREIELLREYRTRLIADVVTGKLDVREAAAALPEADPLGAADHLDEAIDTDAEDLDAIPEEADV